MTQNPPVRDLRIKSRCSWTYTYACKYMDVDLLAFKLPVRHYFWLESNKVTPCVLCQQAKGYDIIWQQSRADRGESLVLIIIYKFWVLKSLIMSDNWPFNNEVIMGNYAK